MGTEKDALVIKAEESLANFKIVSEENKSLIFNLEESLFEANRSTQEKSNRIRSLEEALATAVADVHTKNCEIEKFEKEIDEKYNSVQDLEDQVHWLTESLDSKKKEFDVIESKYKEMENKEENEINLSGIHKNEDIIQAVDVCKISATSPSESELHLKKSDQIESDEQSQNIAEKIVLLASLNAKIELLESR